VARTSYFQNDDLSFEELYKQSIESRPMLNNFGENVLQALRQEYPGKFEEARFDLAEPKDKFRAESKIKNDYDEEQWKAVDLCRAWIVTPNAEDTDLARQYVKDHAEELDLVRVKDRFETPTDTNYRGVLTNVELDNGHIAELRIEHEKMVEAGDLTHLPYEIVQDIERNNEDTGLTPEQKQIVQTLKNDVRDTHQYAAEQAGVEHMLGPEGLKQLDKFDVQHAGQEKTNGYFDKPFELTQDIANELSKDCLNYLLEEKAEKHGFDKAVIEEALALRSAEEAVREEERVQQEKESLEATAAAENRLETLAQEAADARALADQKTAELEQAQTLADEKAQIAEQTASAAADRIERLEYSTQLLKDQMEDLPPNEAAVNERICEKNQAEITELNAEIARTAAEAEAAQEIVETILPEQQQAEAVALAAEAALKEEEARRQEEEQKALEEQRAQEEAQQAEEAKKVEASVQQKEEAAELAEQEAHQKAQEAQKAEELATQKDEEALEAEEIAQQKAKEAEKAEEIALEKEEEAQKAEEAVKQATEEEQETKEFLQAQEEAKQKAIEAEEARAEADLKAEEAKEAEAFAKQKAEEALEAKEDAALKAEEAQQAEAIAEEKAAEAQKARAVLTEEAAPESIEAEEKAAAQELTAKQTEQANEEAQLTEEEKAALAEDATAQNLDTEEVDAAKEITASQTEQTSEKPQLAEEAALATAEGTEAEKALQNDVQETAATEDVAQAEQNESSLQDKADFFALDENTEKTAAEKKLEQLEYSSQLLKDEMEELSPNEAAVYERTYESHQEEIAELKAEIARSATETAQAEQGETALHSEETAGLVASEENATLSQSEEATQQQTAEENQTVDTTLDLSNAAEQDASVTTLDAGQENHVADQSLSGDAQAELPTSTNLEEGLEGTAQVEDSTAISQIAQEEPTELATQGDPPVSTDKNEVLETVESQTDEEEAPSGSQNAGKSSDQEEEPAVQQAVQQTVDDSSRSTAEVETSSASASSETKQEEKREDFTIAAAQVTSMSAGSGGSAGGGGSSMCFFMPIFPSSLSEYGPILRGGHRRRRGSWDNLDFM